MRINLTPGQARILRERQATMDAARIAFDATLTGVLADHVPCEVERLEVAEGGELYAVLADPAAPPEPTTPADD